MMYKLVQISSSYHEIFMIVRPLFPEKVDLYGHSSYSLFRPDPNAMWVYRSGFALLSPSTYELLLR